MATQAIQYTLFEIPANEPKRVRTKWDELAEMVTVSGETGGLVLVHVGQELLGVSRQRIYDMIEFKRIRSWDFFGRKYVCIDDISEFVNSERKPGRPVSNARRPEMATAEKG